MIDSRAIIDPSAKIADNVEIGPFSIIGPDVTIGEGSVIGSHVVVKGPTDIGKYNRIFQFCTVGEDCQDKKFKGESTRLEIGDHNIFREACTVHRGTTQDNSLTKIGSHNLFMVNVHIAHDVIVRDNCILANDTNIAGHVHIGDYVILGGASQVHQFVKVGSHSMCGTGSIVLKDVPAYVMANGNSAKPHGINIEGLKRRGFEKNDIKVLRNAYKSVYRKGLTVEEARGELLEFLKESNTVQAFIDSIDQSSRGIIR
ncbi:acyl-ACP--UDP-N-acetylglucosamine O-acyltransferase [Oceaniserpentilla sp. 4NH20-0058]|uniref:acyl-ACP--UDP-N-acetylglucosamine O-acyltransferase n=1 Tax=Oceaniserpentilla sp. 4NH20-0058 TaxID=3127660 RepID=UPI0031033353